MRTSAVISKASIGEDVPESDTWCGREQNIIGVARELEVHGR